MEETKSGDDGTLRSLGLHPKTGRQRLRTITHGRSALLKRFKNDLGVLLSEMASSLEADTPLLHGYFTSLRAAKAK